MSKIILFDGECNFCNYWVNFVIKYDNKNKFLFASLNSEFGKAKLKHFNISNFASDTFILIDNSKYYMKSDAAFLVIRELNHWSRTLVLLKFIPKFIRDFIYDLIARNRKSLFKMKNYCIVPDSKLKEKFLE